MAITAKLPYKAIQELLNLLQVIAQIFIPTKEIFSHSPPLAHLLKFAASVQHPAKEHQSKQTVKIAVQN